MLTFGLITPADLGKDKWVVSNNTKGARLLYHVTETPPEPVAEVHADDIDQMPRGDSLAIKGVCYTQYRNNYKHPEYGEHTFTFRKGENPDFDPVNESQIVHNSDSEKSIKPA